LKSQQNPLELLFKQSIALLPTLEFTGRSTSNGRGQPVAPLAEQVTIEIYRDDDIQAFLTLAL